MNDKPEKYARLTVRERIKAMLLEKSPLASVQMCIYPNNHDRGVVGKVASAMVQEGQLVVEGMAAIPGQKKKLPVYAYVPGSKPLVEERLRETIGDGHITFVDLMKTLPDVPEKVVRVTIKNMSEARSICIQKVRYFAVYRMHTTPALSDDHPMMQAVKKKNLGILADSPAQDRRARTEEEVEMAENAALYDACFMAYMRGKSQGRCAVRG